MLLNIWNMLFGFQQSCGLSYTTGIKNYDIVDGIICFGGWLDDRITEEQLENASNLKVYIAHGVNDNLNLQCMHSNSKSCST
ncbi:MAG: hypothetical protein P9L91_04920 [Candidatus Zophobacter franzmannii]|nr:hypothetical protein [Candidatus Zophobacter franzmannii]